MIGKVDCLVLWGMPCGVITRDVPVLSFLSPVDEHSLRESHPGREIVTMSRVMDEVSTEGRALYVDIVAQIGLHRVKDGKTLRSSLHRDGKTSQWWYHPLSQRNSEREPTYTYLLMILALMKTVSSKGAATTLELIKAPDEIATVLSGLFCVESRDGIRVNWWYELTRALMGRAKLMVGLIADRWELQRHYRLPDFKADIVMQGYWDWSFSIDPGHPSILHHHYFLDLPGELKERGKKVGYWCWYEPNNRLENRHRSSQEVLKPLENRDDVLLLPSLLNWWDILVAALDFSVLVAMLKVSWKKDFKERFLRNGLDYFPLFSMYSIRGALSSWIPVCCLVEISIERAAQKFHPALLLNFQEHFLVSRAMYAGLKGSGIRSWAMQHCGYNRNKVYQTIEPRIEFAGEPDGESVPHPERVCVMGNLGRTLFSECGYREGDLLSTGSARYDRVFIEQGRDHPVDNVGRSPWRGNVLMATSLPASTDLPLVLAVVEAVKDLKGLFNLRLRQHPNDKMEKLPQWSELSHHLEVSRFTFEEDLKWADLLIFSQSTVAEEAYLLGKPVWQFRFPNPDQSALSAVADIPRYYDVAALRQAFLRAAESSTGQSSLGSDREAVFNNLFRGGREKPSVEIAQAIQGALQAEGGSR